MDRKTFIIGGIVILHIYLLSISITQYLVISRIIAKSYIPFLGMGTFAVLFLGFGTLLHLRLKAMGHKKRTLIWCLAFYFAAHSLGAFLALGYFNVADAITNTHWEHIRTISTGEAMTPWMYMKFVLYLAPAGYLVNWGLFALLWFGNRDPKMRGHSNTRVHIKPANPRVGSYVRNLNAPA